jgi:hypothetical protein
VTLEVQFYYCHPALTEIAIHMHQFSKPQLKFNAFLYPASPLEPMSPQSNTISTYDVIMLPRLTVSMEREQIISLLNTRINLEILFN